MACTGFIVSYSTCSKLDPWRPFALGRRTFCRLLIALLVLTAENWLTSMNTDVFKSLSFLGLPAYTLFFRFPAWRNPDGSGRASLEPPAHSSWCWWDVLVFCVTCRVVHKWAHVDILLSVLCHVLYFQLLRVVRQENESLQRHLTWHLISMKTSVPWALNSPDLSPLDYFLWGYLRNRKAKDARGPKDSPSQGRKPGLCWQDQQRDRQPAKSSFPQGEGTPRV